MKIKKDYLLREIAGVHIVVPVGERVIDFKGMMTLNDSGCFIWKCLSDNITYEQLLSSILDEYEIEEAKARTDLDEFLNTARENGVLDE